MILTFSPVRMDESLSLHRKGDVLTVNGEIFDLGPLPEGGVLPAEATGCPWITGEVTRAGGALRVMLILPHGADAPPDTLFPVPLTLAADGPVALPPHDGPPDGPPDSPLAKGEPA